MDIKDIKDSVILVVDDNPTNLGVLFDYLDSFGFEVLLVQDGEKALKVFESDCPDIILLDIIMPGSDGFEICRRLKANDRTKDIPVIFMSALTEMIDKIKGFEMGAVDYITKPFQQEEVLARLKAHLTIKHQKEQLRELNASKDRFLSIISHDLKNQFAALFFQSDLLFDLIERGDSDANELLGHQRDTLNQTFKLLENLLDWALLQRGELECKPIKLDILKLVMANIKLIGENAERKNISLKSLVKPGSTAYADLKMVETILRNLISNAVKYTNSGGEVELAATLLPDSTEGMEDYIEIAVKDNGIGLKKEDSDKLFRIDIKQQTTGTAKETGTGLGLILCKEFVERNGGKIWIESSPNEGSTFKFTLPVKPLQTKG